MITPPGVPVATVTGFGARPLEIAMQPAIALAISAAPRQNGRLNGMTKCTPPPRERVLRFKLILDRRAVTLELAAHPKVCIVIPNAASVVGRDERVARRLNLTSRYRDRLVGNLACIDTNNATTLRINHRRLLQHRRRPQTVRREGGSRGDKGAALTHYAKSLRRRRAVDVELLAMLHSFAIQRHQPSGAPSLFGVMTKCISG